MSKLSDFLIGSTISVPKTLAFPGFRRVVWVNEDTGELHCFSRVEQEPKVHVFHYDSVRLLSTVPSPIDQCSIPVINSQLLGSGMLVVFDGSSAYLVSMADRKLSQPFNTLHGLVSTLNDLPCCVVSNTHINPFL